MSSLEGPTKAFREFFMMCYHHPKSVTIGIENVTSLQKVTHGNIVSKFTFLSRKPLGNCLFPEGFLFIPETDLPV